MSDIKNSHELWFVKSCDYEGLRETFDALDGEIDKLEAENAALKETQRWIPVSERLPEEKQKILMTWAPKYSQLFPAIFGEGFTDWTFTHWMPLPEPPEADK